MTRKIKIGALISGGGTNLQAIIDACNSDSIDGEVVFVGSDRVDAKGLGRASRHDITTFVVDYNAFIRQYREDPDRFVVPADFDLMDVRDKQGLFGAEMEDRKIKAFLSTRAAAEARLLENIAPFKIDLLVLCGFMRHLTPYFIDRFTNDPDQPNIMNIHPSLLPAFPGMDGYGDTYRHGCKIGGCTVHFVDYGEDSGPIIGQRAFSISESDDLDAVRKNGLELEWQLYPECIQRFAQKRLRVVTLTHSMNARRMFQKKVVKIVTDR